MTRGPTAVRVVGWLFVATGVVGIVAAIVRWTGAPSAGDGATRELGDCLIAVASGAVAGVGGGFTLRGSAWARWLLVAWMAGHLVLSALHGTERLLLHVVIFAPLLLLLFRPASTAFFRAARHDPRA